MGKLKVYRTPIGFHDAYVAAPSQKAALAAWGSTHDLFARGIAEIVTDEALMQEPLERPGTIIKRSRGTTAEQIAALPSPPPSVSHANETKPKPKPKPTAKRVPKPEPRPSHDAVDAVERELTEIKDRHAAQAREWAAEQAALDRRHAELKQAWHAEIERVQQRLKRAEDEYDLAIRKWRG